MRNLQKALLAATVSVSVAVAIWAATPSSTHVRALASDLPPGPLLTIETSDFAGLLRRWNDSSEQKAWLTSASYSAFANSHLFGRLADAQSEFEGAAGGKRGFDSEFLQQVAGKESIFAWYDISKLEFLYISHLPPGKTANVELLQQRAKFSRRESGGTSFYIRTGSTSPEETADADAAAGPSTPRTVAFATRGDWLVLATREDLIANALLLMQSTDSKSSSAATEGWYAAAETAGPTQWGDLHMLLDLQRITTTAAFRTHWIQRNVTAMGQYRAAIVDLYTDGPAFREERVLLPNGSVAEAAQPDLASLEALVPEHAGVFRAWASPQTADALAVLDEKLLTRSTNSTARVISTPEANLTVEQPGSTSDLETRINTVSTTREPSTASTRPLLEFLQSAEISAMLTVDRTDPGPNLFVPIRSAVVLRSAQSWDREKLQDALLAALRSHLTVSGLGLAWRHEHDYMTLGAATPFALFVDGNTAVVTNDAGLMSEMLARRSMARSPEPAVLIAGFRHTQERKIFRQLTLALAPAPLSAKSDTDDSGHGADFFSGSIGSLSDAFQRMESEHIVERRDGLLTRQTVTYKWNSR